METGKRSAIMVAAGDRRINRQSQEVVWNSDIILYDTTMADTGHYAFVKICEMHNIKSEPLK